MSDMNEVALSVADALASSVSEDVEGAFLLGFVAVAEWMDKDGVRWLTRESGTGVGDDVPKWQARGYLNEALNHWPEEEPEDDQ